MASWNMISPFSWEMNEKMETIKPFIELGIDLDRQDAPTFDTIAHVWAAQKNPHSIEILRMLLDRNADFTLKNIQGLTPLMLAAIGNDWGPNHQAFELILEQTKDVVSRHDQIIALELIGACEIFSKFPTIQRTVISYWRRSLELRLLSPNEPGLRNDSAQLISDRARLVFGHISEIQSLDELNNMASKRDGLRIQALWIIYRILGPGHRYFQTSLFSYVSAKWLSINNQESLFNEFRLVMECCQSSEVLLCNEFVNSCAKLTLIFDYLKRKAAICDDNNNGRQTLCFDNVMEVLECVSNELHKATDERLKKMEIDLKKRDILLDCVVQLTSLLLSLESFKNKNLRMKICLYNLVKLDLRDSRSGYNLLLRACSPLFCVFLTYHFDVLGKPLHPVIELLLELDADPNSLDSEGNCPLDLLKLKGEKLDSPTVTALIAKGAHANVLRSGLQMTLQPTSLQRLSATIVRKSVHNFDRLPQGIKLILFP